MDVAMTLEIAELDLDDDIFIGINNGSHVDLFEVYKIAERKGPIEYNDIGSWSDKDGLAMTTAPKYYRRGDLKVKLLLSMNEKEYLNKLTVKGTYSYKIQAGIQPY